MLYCTQDKLITYITMVYIYLTVVIIAVAMVKKTEDRLYTYDELRKEASWRV